MLLMAVDDDRAWRTEETAPSYCWVRSRAAIADDSRKHFMSKDAQWSVQVYNLSSHTVGASLQLHWFINRTTWHAHTPSHTFIHERHLYMRVCRPYTQNARAILKRQLFGPNLTF